MATNFDAPQSRNEAILQNILGADNELLEPQSRIEALLMELLDQESTDGGGSSSIKAVLRSMLIPILREVIYGADQQAAITALETALSPTVVTYTIQNALTNVTTDNETGVVVSGTAYSAMLTADANYAISSVTVTMGGTDITSTAYSDGAISIASVTGNVVITAVAESLIETYTPEMSAGYISPTTGTIGSTSAYQHTEIIPIREGDKVYGTSYDSQSATAINAIAPRYHAAYDENGAFYAAGGNSAQATYKDSAPLVVPSGVYGIVFSFANRYANDIVIYVDKSERVVS